MLRLAARLIRTIGKARRFLFNSRIRSEQLTRALHRDLHYQGATFTEPDRYPLLFGVCRDELGHLPAPAILSFGCSTGEEAFSLARYLPQALVIGIDLNRWCLRRARRANRNPCIQFFHPLDAGSPALGGFNAIFAMAVFQRSEHWLDGTELIRGGFTFERFEEEIARLDRRLKIGGIFFTDHSDFRFADTLTAQQYAPLDFEGNESVEYRPLFGRDNKLVGAEYRTHQAYRKLRSAEDGDQPPA